MTNKEIFKKVKNNLVENRICNRCGSLVLKTPYSKEENVNLYMYECLGCDNDLYAFETHSKELDKKELAQEVINICECAIDLYN